MYGTCTNQKSFYMIQATLKCVNSSCSTARAIYIRVYLLQRFKLGCMMQPKVTGRFGHRSFLTGTCPFVTVRTACPFAPILAQHKMWDTHPWGLLVLGWEGCAHGTNPFSPAHPFIKKKNGPGPIHGTMPLVAVIPEIFGHNWLRSECLQVQPVTCWHPSVLFQ
jgi:hypothetical protein